MSTGYSVFLAAIAVALLVTSFIVGMEWINDLTRREWIGLFLFGVGMGVAGGAMRNLNGY